MNEQIKKLAEKAGYKHIDAVGACEDYAYFDHEEFAKLIVKECINIASQEDFEVMMKEGYPCSQTSNKIKEHFGVE